MRKMKQSGLSADMAAVPAAQLLSVNGGRQL